MYFCWDLWKRRCPKLIRHRVFVAMKAFDEAAIFLENLDAVVWASQT